MLIAIMVYPGVTALDVVGPYEILHRLPEVELRFVWKEVGPVVTDSGVLVLGATHSFQETPRPDVFLVPGSATHTATTAADPAVREWVRASHQSARLTTSVCSGSIILAAAGLLKGRTATSHWAALPGLKRLGVDARSEERIVRDGNIWTSAGVSAGIDLALALAAELAGPEVAQAQQLFIEYDPHPPFDAGHMSKASPEVRARAQAEMRRLAVTPREVTGLSRIALNRWMGLLMRRVRRTRSSQMP